MKQIAMVIAAGTLACASPAAFAWAHANAYGGGGTFHAQGSDSTTRTNAWGGSATHTE